MKISLWQLPIYGLAALVFVAAAYLLWNGQSVPGANAQGATPPADCVSDDLLDKVRHYYDVNQNKAPGYGKNWKRALIAFGDAEDSQLTPFTAAEARESEQRWSGWKPIREALECIEAANAQPDPTATPARYADPGAHRYADPGARRDADPGAHRDADPGAHRDADPGAHRDADPGAHRDADPGAHRGVIHDLQPAGRRSHGGRGYRLARRSRCQ